MAVFLRDGCLLCSKQSSVPLLTLHNTHVPVELLHHLGAWSDG